MMNVELQNILNQIVSEQGDTILSEPKRVSSFLSDLAREAPKPQKTALIKSLEHGFAKTLKDVPAPERNVCKQKLAQRLNEEEGLELRLCEETLELLAAVLFGERQKKKDNLCKNCGKELQEGWKTCPYCETKVEKTNQVISPAITSGSSNAGNGIEQMNSANLIVSQTKQKNVSVQVLKEGRMIYMRGLNFPNEKGHLFLYNDKLEWKGINNFDIPFDKISTVKISWYDDLIINMVDKTKFEFRLLNSEESVVSWENAINKVLNKTKYYKTDDELPLGCTILGLIILVFFIILGIATGM